MKMRRKKKAVMRMVVRRGRRRMNKWMRRVKSLKRKMNTSNKKESIPSWNNQMKKV
jgi:hypothetical protein